MMRYALTPTDALFGFQKIVQAAWFFPGRIDPEILRSSLAEFGVANPIFCGRVSRKPRTARNFTPRPPFSDYEVVTSAESGIPLSVGELEACHTLMPDLPEHGLHAGTEPSCPDNVMRGAEPCVGVDLTHLTHRQRPSGSVLGVRMSHAVVTQLECTGLSRRLCGFTGLACHVWETASLHYGDSARAEPRYWMLCQA